MAQQTPTQILIQKVTGEIYVPLSISKNKRSMLVRAILFGDFFVTRVRKSNKGKWIGKLPKTANTSRWPLHIQRTRYDDLQRLKNGTAEVFVEFE